MATHLVLKSFEINDILWRIPIHPKLFFRWNCQTLQFDPVESFIKTLPWWILFFLPQLQLLVMSCVLFVVVFRHPPFNNMGNWVIAGATVQGSLFTLGITLCLFYYRMDFFAYTNHVIAQHHERRENANYGQGLVSCLKDSNREVLKFIQRLSCDTTGIVTMIIATQLAPAPAVITACGIYLSTSMNIDLDFFHHIWAYFVSKEQGSIICIIRVLINFYHIAEIACAGSYILVLILAITQSTVKQLQKVQRISETDFLKGIREYKAMFILSQIGSTTTSWIVVIAMGTGHSLFMIFFSTTVVGFRVLPLQVYWVAPLITIIILLVIMIAFPFATKCFNLSGIILRNWKRRHMSLARRKSLKALRPVCFAMGSLRVIDNDTTTEYFASIFDRTTSFIIFLRKL
ncbi:unnamed protein product [Orchesella dallaii]|uniref:Odorant receptor n=1 Tax=Orchesella dallaii TaxID=48710 RepID=A0ABP1RIM9_9HEXA